MDSPDLADLFFGQLGVMVCFTMGVTVLGDHIVNVVGLRTEKEMGDIAAFPVVAVVETFNPGRNWAMLALPHHPMDFGGFVDDLDDTVSASVQKTAPFKAPIRPSLVLRSQPMFKGPGSVAERNTSAGDTTVFPYIPRSRFKRCFAYSAILHGGHDIGIVPMKSTRK